MPGNRSKVWSRTSAVRPRTYWRRSGGNAGSGALPEGEPAELVFFVDHSLGTKQVAEALRNAGCAVELHDDHFPPRTKDADWLAEVARRGWVVLSKDLNIASNALERVTLFESGVRAFLLSRQDLSGPAQVTVLLRGLRRIRNIARSEPPPFIARVSPSGNVKVLTGLKRAWRRGKARSRDG